MELIFIFLVAKLLVFIVRIIAKHVLPFYELFIKLIQSQITPAFLALGNLHSLPAHVKVPLDAPHQFLDAVPLGRARDVNYRTHHSPPAIHLLVVPHARVVGPPHDIGSSHPIALGQYAPVRYLGLVEPPHHGAVEVGGAVPRVDEDVHPAHRAGVPPRGEKILRLTLPVVDLIPGRLSVAVPGKVDEVSRRVRRAEGRAAVPPRLAAPRARASSSLSSSLKLSGLHQGEVIDLLRPPRTLADPRQVLPAREGVDEAGLADVGPAEEGHLRYAEVGELPPERLGADILENAALERRGNGGGGGGCAVDKEGIRIDPVLLHGRKGDVRVRACRRRQEEGGDLPGGILLDHKFGGAGRSDERRLGSVQVALPPWRVGISGIFAPPSLLTFVPRVFLFIFVVLPSTLSGTPREGGALRE
mmetsp:Transcript_44465/g.135534  ORF Transcript_44465/g.135534 Transcript_44465/m.135534 type:complete len:416 (+) Transcript_44465:542-1789(+)